MQRIAIQNTLRAARRQALNPHVVRAASKRFNSSQAALSGASKSSSSSVNGAKLLFPLSIVAGLAFVFQDMIDVKIVSPPKKEDKKEQPATEEQPSEASEQEPAINEESTEESGSDDAESNASPRSDAPSEKKPSEEKHDLSDEKPVESEKKEGETKEEKEQEAKEESNEESQEGEQAGGQAAAFNPETGEINWDCPCLGGMASGPCGEEFKAAFSCFVYSEADPKGIDCIEKFKGMQDCFRQHPDVYAEELREDEVPVGQSEEAGATEQEPKAEDKKPEEEKSEENNE